MKDIDFKVKNDTLILHEDIKAIKKNFSILFDVSNYNNKDKSKLYIARLVGMKKYPAYTSTKRKGDLLIAGTGATAGIVFEVPDKLSGLAFSYNAPRIRVDEKTSKKFIYYYLK